MYKNEQVKKEEEIVHWLGNQSEKNVIYTQEKFQSHCRISVHFTAFTVCVASSSALGAT